jgi:hypothetical protein
MRAIEVAVILAKQRKDIRSIVFTSYRPTVGLDARLPRRPLEIKKILKDATRVLESHQLPLWAAIMDAYLERPLALTELLAQALLHDRSDEDRFELGRTEVQTDILDGIVARLKPGYVLAVQSDVSLAGGGTAHIPMMDFACRPSPYMQHTVKRVLGKIRKATGLLLESGRSYHYYGLDLLSETEWRSFLGRALLLTPMVDVRYVAHRLIDGFCRLRLTATNDKPVVPAVVSIVTAEDTD